MEAVITFIMNLVKFMLQSRFLEAIIVTWWNYPAPIEVSQVYYTHDNDYTSNWWNLLDKISMAKNEIKGVSDLSA